MQPPITTSPVRSLQTLLGKALDYAGTFPPANLDVADAIRSYAEYRSGSAAWFLSRFICPADRLDELRSHLSLFTELGTLQVSVVCPRPGDLKSFRNGLKEALAQAFRFAGSSHPHTRVDSIELSLPSAGVSGSGVTVIADLIGQAAQEIEAAGEAPITPSFEITATEQWVVATRRTIEAIGRHNADWKGTVCGRAAFKLRTGGLTAEAFPRVEQVVTVISACVDDQVPFKCTAGLHHPFRRYHESVRTKMHGFLNIFAAAVLAHALPSVGADMRSILADEDASHFRFFEDGFTWQGRRVSLEQIEAARRSLIVSFGSCSVEEPLEDLRELGLL